MFDTLWCMREHCMFRTVKNMPLLGECVVVVFGVLFLVYMYCHLCPLVECDGARMNTYTYHCRMDGPH